MKTQRNRLLFGLMLVLAGGLAWWYFAAGNSRPGAMTARPVSLPTTAKDSGPAIMVEAPKIAPAPAGDAPPTESAATRDAEEAQAERLRFIARQRIDRLQASYEARLAAAPEGAARAQLAQQMQSQKDVIARLQNQLTRMAEPPEDIGVVDLADGMPGPAGGTSHTLSTGETFAVAITNDNGRGTEIQFQSFGTPGDNRSVLIQRVKPMPGQPMILSLADGALVIFTPMGNVILPSPNPQPFAPSGPPPPTSDHVLPPSTSSAPPTPSGNTF